MHQFYYTGGPIKFSTVVKTNAVFLSIRRKMTTSIIKPMFCIVLSNFVCSIPWLAIYMYFINTHESENNVHSELRILAMSIMYVPIALDPLIFLGFSTKGRKAIQSLFRKHQAHVQPVPREVSPLAVTIFPEITAIHKMFTSAI